MVNHRLQKRGVRQGRRRSEHRMKRNACEHFENRISQRNDRRGERTHYELQLNFRNHFRSKRHLGKTSLITNP